FQIVNLRPDMVKYTHSCNIDKPWCCKCAKCAYVWLCFMAYFPIVDIEPIFNYKNLLDMEENQIWYKQLLGLDSHTPFECVGKKEEVNLAFEILRLKGYKGKAMDFYINEGKFKNFDEIIDQHLIVDSTMTSFPEELRIKILSFLESVVNPSKEKY